MKNSRLLTSFARISRAGEWWQFKIAPVFAMVYATAILYGIPLDSLYWFLALILAALIPGAVFVSVLNDLTDLEDDALAGKENRLAGKPKSLGFLILCVCLVIGIVVGWTLPLIPAVFYFAAWLSYALYSAPPVRLKIRGLPGVVADALGANVFPQLFAVSLCASWFDRQFINLWFIVVAVWSFSWGVRGILWHQLKDLANDRTAGVVTFASRCGTKRVYGFVHRIVLPIEIVSIVFILSVLGGIVPFVALIVYLAFAYLRYRRAGVGIVAVRPTEEHRLVMDEYYRFFLPYSLILYGLGLTLSACFLIVAHTILFPFRIAGAIRVTRRIAVRSYYWCREFLLGY